MTNIMMANSTIANATPMQKHIRFLCKNIYDSSAKTHANSYAQTHTIPIQNYIRFLCINIYETFAKTHTIFVQKHIRFLCNNTYDP